jgi:hypothetical protein
MRSGKPPLRPLDSRLQHLLSLPLPRRSHRLRIPHFSIFLLYLAFSTTEGRNSRTRHLRGNQPEWARSFPRRASFLPSFFSAVSPFQSFADTTSLAQSNLLTGLTNITLETMYASETTALTVMVLYSGAVVGIAWALRKRRIKLG